MNFNFHSKLGASLMFGEWNGVNQISLNLLNLVLSSFVLYLNLLLSNFSVIFKFFC